MVPLPHSMFVQVVVQVPFEITVNTIPVTSLLPTLSKRRHAFEQTLYKAMIKRVHEEESVLFGKGLSSVLHDCVAAFDVKLKSLFPRLFSTDGTCAALLCAAACV